MVKSTDINQQVGDGGFGVVNTAPNAIITINSSSISKVNSMLRPALEYLIENYDPLNGKNYQIDTPNIQEKIIYNNVLVYKQIFSDLMNYDVVIEEMLDELGEESDLEIERFTWAIKQRYLAAKHKLLIKNPVDTSKHVEVQAVINKNADSLIEDIRIGMLNDLSTIIDTNQEIGQHCVLLIICYGFISCNILEDPRIDNTNKS